MDPVTLSFWIFFSATLVMLPAALYTGFRGRRRVHLVTAPTMVALLAVTIVFAEKMGAARKFPADEMSIHLFFAKSATLAVLTVVITGLVLLRRPRWRRFHRVCVVLFVLLALTAIGTGLWVYSLSTA